MDGGPLTTCHHHINHAACGGMLLLFVMNSHASVVVTYINEPPLTDSRRVTEDASSRFIFLRADDPSRAPHRLI